MGNKEDTEASTAQIEQVVSATDADIAANKGNYEVKTTQDSRFAAAAARDKPSALSKGLLMLYPILFVAFMNSAANGFDGNTFGGVSALPNFQTRFGTNVAASQGFLAALYILGKSHLHIFAMRDERLLTKCRQCAGLVRCWPTRGQLRAQKGNGGCERRGGDRHRRPSSSGQATGHDRRTYRTGSRLGHARTICAGIYR